MSWAVLACTGLDKPEGSVAREVALRLAEESGVEIVCPVVLNRTPARYKKTFADNRLLVVDGCATRCASKLAAATETKPAQKLLVSEVMKQAGRSLGPTLRLYADGFELVRIILDQIRALGAGEAGGAGRDETEEVAAGPKPEMVAFPPPTDFMLVVHDKYEFRIPSTGYLFNSNDVWVRVSGNRARVGISDYMQQRLTDINYVEPPEIGARIEQFGEVGSVESTKAAFELVSPVSGAVVALNPAVEDVPELINEDPYGEGWVAELELTDWEQDRELLIDGATYAEEVERKAAEE